MAHVLQGILAFRVGRVAVAGAVAYGATEWFPELLHEPDGRLKFPGVLDQNSVVLGSMFAAWKWWSADLVPDLVGRTAFRAVTEDLPTSGHPTLGPALLG